MDDWQSSDNQEPPHDVIIFVRSNLIREPVRALFAGHGIWREVNKGGAILKPFEWKLA